MKLRVSSQEMRRFVATMPNPVSAAMRAASRLSLLCAVITASARNGRIPRDAISQCQCLAGPVPLQACAELLDQANGLMPENDRQRDRQFSFPEMHIRAA